VGWAKDPTVSLCGNKHECKI